MSKYILVTGGELFNKGAQAMTFITVDEMARRHPDKQVVLLSNRDYKRSKEEKAQYKFLFAKYPAYRYILMLQFGAGNWLLKHAKGDVGQFVRMLNDSEMVLDISGYAFGSNWGMNKSISYLLRIGMAKTAKVAVYLMPQSFGPFDFKGKKALWLKYLIPRILPYPKKIMAREQDGYEFLKNHYGLNNVVKTYDLVLQNKGINPQNIYHSPATRTPIVIEKGSVAIIPNQKLFVHGNPTELDAMYNKIVEELIQLGKRIYLIYHSKEDLEICRSIKERYKNEEQVQLVEKELSCLEVDDLVGSFDYVVASRFHSIVHSYKNCVPALVLGWAGKYKELVETFEQEQFVFDVRVQLESEAICKALRQLDEEHQVYAGRIKKTLEIVQKDSVYDMLDA